MVMLASVELSTDKADGIVVGLARRRSSSEGSSTVIFDFLRLSYHTIPVREFDRRHLGALEF